MATTYAMGNLSSLQAVKSRLRDYVTLTKPEVNLLILMTTSAGYYLASRGPFRRAGLVLQKHFSLECCSASPEAFIWRWR